MLNLEPNLRAAELDQIAKGWGLGDVLETGKEGKKGEACRCDRDSPANQTWVGDMVLQGMLGVCLLLPAGMGFLLQWGCATLQGLLH